MGVKKRHSCRVCGKKFRHLKNMRAHVKAVGHEVPTVSDLPLSRSGRSKNG